jgi:hypothetical protein
VVTIRNIPELCILPTEYTYGYRMILKTDGDYFPMQHSPIIFSRYVLYEVVESCVKELVFKTDVLPLSSRCVGMQFCAALTTDFHWIKQITITTVISLQTYVF